MASSDNGENRAIAKVYGFTLVEEVDELVRIAALGEDRLTAALLQHMMF
ncbi:MAG TPA: hypothetical protein V6C88_15345 [Chroococcidiopsis sp.]